MPKQIQAIAIKDRKDSRVQVIRVYDDFDIYTRVSEWLSVIANLINRDKYDLTVCVFDYKLRGFTTKYILKTALNGRIPKQVIEKKEERPPGSGGDVNAP